LLYLGAAVVASVGLSWLILAKPWAGATTLVDSPRNSGVMSTSPTAEAVIPTSAVADRTIEESLRLAELAQAAGMLFEPPRYSAWSLYMEILESDPANAAARDGAKRVADAIVARASTALEQGRIEAAKESIEAVLARLPDHAAALQMTTQIEESAAGREAEADAPAVLIAAVKPATEAPPRRAMAPAAPPAISPLRRLRGQFDAALSAGQLLLPEGESAKHFFNLMAKVDDSDPAVTEARDALLVTVFQRADEATQAVDAAAAETWLDEAAGFGADTRRVKQARAALTERLIEAQSGTPVPAATLVLAAYVPPRYPSSAANLEIEGWVDLEFVVTPDGSTTDVMAVAGSHEELFRTEAVAAVQNWRFEPRIFLDQPISQTTYTRIRFVFE
jgi:TonB family protein